MGFLMAERGNAAILALIYFVYRLIFECYTLVVIIKFFFIIIAPLGKIVAFYMCVCVKNSNRAIYFSCARNYTALHRIYTRRFILIRGNKLYCALELYNVFVRGMKYIYFTRGKFS